MTHALPGVGVFGTGITAKLMIHLLKTSGFRIEALWGRTEDEAKELASLLDIPFSTCSIDDVLLNQNVDLVCINCPPFLHSQIAVKTLGIGKNVLCERPAGLDQDDTTRMLKAALYYPSLMSLMTYHLRFLPTFMEMKQQVGDGNIGELLVVEVRVHSGVSLNINYNWSHDSKMGGGVLTNLGGHFVDIVNFVSGQRAVKVHGFVTTFQKQTAKVSGFREVTSDDFCTFQMKMDQGACCTCVLNNNIPGKFSYEVLFIGTSACLIVKDGVLLRQSRVSGNSAAVQEIITKDCQDTPEGLETIFPSEVLAQIPVPLCQGTSEFINSLKSSFQVQNDRRNWNKTILDRAATFEDALYVQTVLESIRRSSQTSDWEKVAHIEQKPMNKDTLLQSINSVSS
nr:glucose-fructose oxidoreductase domain-containing protein 1 [Ciona intestinalis]|eukprot:XP_002124667.1 glucose-fructose oxidoreductase domain-containing protein 1 [Ciona intestinalis]